MSWSHFIEILQLKDPLQRDFYAEMCRIERWGVRTLRAKIGGMLFERTALSRKPQDLIKQELAKLREEDTLTPDLVFRDPYFLDFLGLKDTFAEKDLEALREATLDDGKLSTLVLKLADRIHVLSKGTLLASGTPEEIQSDPRVLEEYAGVMGASDTIAELQESAPTRNPE